MPKFWDQIEAIYKAKDAHEFLLHLNVRDLALDEVYGYLPMRDFLLEQLNKVGCDMALSYSRSEGVTFPDLKTRSEFQSVLGLAPVAALSKPEGTAQTSTPSTQRRRINAAIQGDGQLAEQSFPRKPAEALPMLERLFRQRIGDLKVGLIIDFVEKIAADDDETLARWAIDLELKMRNHIILLLTENLANVPPSLSLNSNIPVIQVPLPDSKERLDFIRHLQTLKDDKLELESGLKAEDMAKATGGLNLFSIHDIYLHAKSEKKPLSFGMIASRMKSAIQAASRGFLEVVDHTHGFEAMGGLKHVIAYLQGIIQDFKSGDFKRVPMGILFLGPPGVGKTLTARALAKESQMNFVKLKTVRERWAGQTEYDLSLAISLIKSLLPVVVFIDDLDRLDQLPNSLELLQFMSDISLRGQVLWIGATNRPDKLGMSIRKLGVFVDKLSFLVPDAAERAEIFQKLFVKYQLPYEAQMDFTKPASDELARWHTGAELEVIVNRGYRLAREAKRDRVTQEDLIKATTDFIPGYAAEVYEFMSLLALREVNSQQQLPRNLPADLKEKIYENGTLSKWKVEQRIKELESKVGMQ